MARNEVSTTGVVPGRIAVMDIGSNAARVAVMDERDGRLVTVATQREALRLMLAIGPGGRIDAATEKRIRDTIASFAAVARAAGAERTIAVATSAIRESQNGGAVVRRIAAATGVDFRIIDGATEARSVFEGVVNEFKPRNGVVLDIGGGTMQLARFRDGALLETHVLPLGSLRLSAEFLHGDPASLLEVVNLVAHTAATFAAAGIAPMRDGDALYVTGGTLRNAMSVASGGEVDPAGMTITAAELAGLADRLRGQSLSERAAIKGLRPDRADSILGGLLAAITVMSGLRASACTVSGSGLREGVARQILAGHEVGVAQQVTSRPGTELA